MLARRRVPPPTVKTARIPAPVGGINTIDGGMAMPPQDATYLYNLLSAEYGLRSRLGYQEWCINLTGDADNTVRTVLPFAASNPTNDKLFATTSTGIWDVSDSSTAPTQSLTFTTSTGDAGWGTCCAMATPAGRFLLYCDEVNGLFVYTEGGSWAAAASGVAALWTASTTYLVDDQVVNGSDVYKCTAAGVSASSGGPTGTTTGITDGTVTWDYVSAATSGAIGPSVADQEAGFSIAATDFRFVTVFKNRVWLVENNSTRAWYLDTNAIAGVATSFDFGPKMRSGGPLRGLYDWSYDGGNGLDTLLVGISGAGDVVIYQGTDPSSASTFGIKGSWYVGGVPSGRRIATNYGGELLILSLIGIIPLSKLVVGRDPADWKQYETAKITNLFNDLASQRQAMDGWSLLVHPTDNALLVLVPTANGAPTEQLAMAFGTKGWSRYRDLPMLSAAAWNGVLYFGTIDGRVCKNADYVDNVQIGFDISQPTQTGGSGSGATPTSSGTASAAATYALKIVSAGTAGASPTGGSAAFEWSSDGGNTWSASTKCFTDGNTLGTTGIVVTWGSGSYGNQTYSFDVAPASSYVPVQFSGLSAFRDSSGNFKRVEMIRPTVMSQGANPLIQCVAKYDFDITEPSPPSGSPTSGANSWDSATWDTSTFGGDYNASQPLTGAVGMGRNVAVAFQGAAVARTVIVGFDVFFREGWQL